MRRRLRSFFSLYKCPISVSGLFDPMTLNMCHIQAYILLCTEIIFTKFKGGEPLRSQLITFFMLIRYVTLRP